MFRLNLSTGYFYYVALSLDAVYTSHVVYSVSRNGALRVCELTCSRLYNLRAVSASGRVYTEVVVALRTTQQGFIRHGTSWRVRAEYGWKLSGLLRRFLNSFSVAFSDLISVLPARRSTCYDNVAAWLAGWVSVTHQHCINMAKSIFKPFQPSGSPTILVSSDPCADTQFQGKPLQRRR